MAHLSAETRMQRRWHREINRRIRAAGLPIPVARKAWRVSIDAMEMPQWAKDKAQPTLSISETHVWFRSRRDANLLFAMNKSRGGCGSIDRVEFRRCQRCGLVLLGVRAAEMREWERLNPGESKQCGPGCKEIA